MANPPATTPHILAALFAILLRPALYARMARNHGDSNARAHRTVFVAQWLDALLWTVGAGLAALLGAYMAGRLHTGPVDLGKALVCAGAWLGGLATWFALANAADTWDRDGRLDTALRGFHFKLLFAPGLILTLIGSGW